MVARVQVLLTGVASVSRSQAITLDRSSVSASVAPPFQGHRAAEPTHPLLSAWQSRMRNQPPHSCTPRRDSRQYAAMQVILLFTGLVRNKIVASGLGPTSFGEISQLAAVMGQ